MWWQQFKVFTWRAKIPHCPPRTSPTSCHRSSAVTRYSSLWHNIICFQVYFILLWTKSYWCWTKCGLYFQDCLRACQEQIESLLEFNLRQAQQHSNTTDAKRVDEDVDLSCTPTDVRDINIWWWKPHSDLILEGKLSTEGWDEWAGALVPDLIPNPSPAPYCTVGFTYGWHLPAALYNCQDGTE